MVKSTKNLNVSKFTLYHAYKTKQVVSPKRRGPTYYRDHLTPGATTLPDSDLISCTHIT
jgi:hypothetical protein